uniref:Uncharacterized protein n=1 Tax=Rhizophora mucronata TaxID=61149 RepID=A0A2P2ND17_RHIMU
MCNVITVELQIDQKNPQRK